MRRASDRVIVNHGSAVFVETLYKNLYLGLHSMRVVQAQRQFRLFTVEIIGAERSYRFHIARIIV